MSDEPVILINLLKVTPGKQDALIALLKQNIDRVIRTLHGWKTTRLIAATDGAGARALARAWIARNGLIGPLAEFQDAIVELSKVLRKAGVKPNRSAPTK